MPMSPLEYAEMFCKKAHQGQTRKYTGEDYHTHPIAVCDILKQHGITDDTTLISALLHDVIEDTKYTKEEIISLFGYKVGIVVDGVSNRADKKSHPDLNRKKRHEININWISFGDSKVHNIKLADAIHNCSSIKIQDPKFWKTYKEEKKKLLSVCVHGMDSLKEELRQILED